MHPRFLIVFGACLATIGGAPAEGVADESLVWRGCGISKTLLPSGFIWHRSTTT